MINVLGQNYYLDLNELDNFIQIKNEELTGNTETFSVIKFEVVGVVLLLVPALMLNRIRHIKTVSVGHSELHGI